MSNNNIIMGDNNRKWEFVKTAPVPTIDQPVDSGWSDSGADGHSLEDYWHSALKNKGKIALITVLGLLVGLILYIVQVPLFYAETTLEIQPVHAEGNSNSRGLNPDAMVSIDTQVRILQSRPLRRSVIEKMKSEEQPVQEHPSRAEIWLQRLKLDSLMSHRTPSYGDGLRVAASNLRIRAVPQTWLIEISTSAPDPDVAADFVNTVVEKFVEQNIESRAVAIQDTNSLLNRQLESAKANLERSQAALQSYAQTAGLPMSESLIAEEKLRAVQQQLTSAQGQRVDRQAKRELASGVSLDNHPDLLNDPAIRQIESQIADQKRQLNQLLAVYTPAHPNAQKIQIQITDLESQRVRERNRVLARLQGEHEEARKREQMLARVVSGQTAEVSSQGQKKIRFEMIKREVDANRLFYESLQQSAKELTVVSAMRANNIRVIDPAVPPSAPHEPDLPRNVGFGSAFGLAISLVYLFVRQTADRSVRGPGDGAAYMNVPELGVIPRATTLSPLPIAGGSPVFRLKRPMVLNLDLNGGEGQQAVELMTWHQKPSPVAECFRSTVTSLLFTKTNGDLPKIVTVTSPLPSEGKTTVISNLGIALAEIGQRVLLIDADMRGTRLHNIFSVPNTWGLSDLLQGGQDFSKMPLEALVRPTEIPNLYVLPSGPATNQIAKLLFSNRPQQLLARLRKEFDRILIDTPPVLSFADARVLGRLSDGAVLILRSGNSQREDALLAARTLRMDGTTLLGTILNDWDSSRDVQRYGKYRYNYGAGF